jgi:integrase
MTKSVSKEDRGWNIYRRGDGQQVLQYRVAPGKWRETRIPREHHTERQAERWALAWLSEYRKTAGTRPVLPEPEGDNGPTIRSLCDKWLDLGEANPKLAPGTRQQHKTSMLAHVRPYPEVADAPIARLGPAVLRQWVRKVRDDGKMTTRWEKEEDGKRTRSVTRGGKLAPFTCRNVVNSLTAFFADAMAEEWIDVPANPMKHEAVRREIPNAVTVAGKHTIIHFTRPVAERLLASCGAPEWRRVRTILAVTSGMAEGELSGLRWDDLDLGEKTEVPIVRITKALAKRGDTRGGPRSGRRRRRTECACSRCIRSRRELCGPGTRPGGRSTWGTHPSPPVRSSRTRRGRRGARTWRRCFEPTFERRAYRTRTRVTRTPRTRRAGASPRGSTKRAWPKGRSSA